MQEEAADGALKAVTIFFSILHLKNEIRRLLGNKRESKRRGKCREREEGEIKEYMEDPLPSKL